MKIFASLVLSNMMMIMAFVSSQAFAEKPCSHLLMIVDDSAAVSSEAAWIENSIRSYADFCIHTILTASVLDLENQLNKLVKDPSTEKIKFSHLMIMTHGREVEGGSRIRFSKDDFLFLTQDKLPETRRVFSPLHGHLSERVKIFLGGCNLFYSENTEGVLERARMVQNIFDGNEVEVFGNYGVGLGFYRFWTPFIFSTQNLIVKITQNFLPMLFSSMILNIDNGFFPSLRYSMIFHLMFYSIGGAAMGIIGPFDSAFKGIKQEGYLVKVRKDSSTLQAITAFDYFWYEFLSPFKN